MAKKNENIKPEIVENEPVISDEKDIITEEVPAEDIIKTEEPEGIIENSDGDVKTEEPSVEAPEIVENEKTISAEQDAKDEKNSSNKKQDALILLKIEIPFCDKYTDVNYEVDDIVEFKEARAKELLKDERKLVSEVK